MFKQVATLGYVGLGFSNNGRMKGSDIVIGWIKEDSVAFLDVSLSIYSRGLIVIVLVLRYIYVTLRYIYV